MVSDTEVPVKNSRSISGTTTAQMNTTEVQASNASPATAAPLMPARMNARKLCGSASAGNSAIGTTPQIAPVAQAAARNCASRWRCAAALNAAAGTRRHTSHSSSRNACNASISPPQRRKPLLGSIQPSRPTAITATVALVSAETGRVPSNSAARSTMTACGGVAAVWADDIGLTCEEGQTYCT